MTGDLFGGVIRRWVDEVEAEEIEAEDVKEHTVDSGVESVEGGSPRKQGKIGCVSFHGLETQPIFFSFSRNINLFPVPKTYEDTPGDGNISVIFARQRFTLSPFSPKSATLAMSTDIKLPHSQIPPLNKNRPQPLPSPLKHSSITTNSERHCCRYGLDTNMFEKGEEVRVGGRIADDETGVDRGWDFAGAWKERAS